jgi:DNA-binding FrmR family transcriptional regulator
MSRPESQPESPPASPSASPPAPPPASPPAADLEKVVNRLRRIEGQVRGLQRMVAGSSPCEEILTQLSATRAALDRVGIFLITHKIRECLLNEGDTSSEAAVQRALETFQKYAQHLQTPPGDDGP